MVENCFVYSQGLYLGRVKISSPYLFPKWNDDHLKTTPILRGHYFDQKITFLPIDEALFEIMTVQNIWRIFPNPPHFNGRNFNNNKYKFPLKSLCIQIFFDPIFDTFSANIISWFGGPLYVAWKTYTLDLMPK